MSSLKEINRILVENGVGVMPTDTIYGVVGSAFSKKAVARIYTLRRRNRRKPMIILISSLRDLERFHIRLHAKIRKALEKFWPGKVSIILPCGAKKFVYLHRGTKTLAVRLPAKKSLRELLRHTGPLVAPSANPEGRPPARTIKEARRYFGDRVDFYLDVGRLSSRPSSLIKLEKGKIIILR